MKTSIWFAQKLAFSKQKQFTSIIIRIAIAAVALSSMIVIIAISTVDGFQQSISAKIFGFWGHIHIASPSLSFSHEYTPLEARPSLLDSIQSIGKIKKPPSIEGNHFFPNTRDSTIGGVKYVTPYILKAGVIKTKSNIEGVIFKGIASITPIEEYLIEKPKNWSTDSTSEESPIILSVTTANRLNTKINNRVLIYFEKGGELIPHRFIVSGIYKTGLEEYDKTFAIVPINTLINLLNFDKNSCTGIEVTLDHLDDIDYFDQYIYQNILPPNLVSETIIEKNPNIFDWLSLQKINAVVILTLMFLVAIINMTTSLLILILERTNMIGILKSIGYRNWTIRKIFLYHSLYISFVGISIGVGLGLLICYIQKSYGILRLNEAEYYLSTVPIFVTWWKVLGVVGLFMVVILFSLILPTYLVTKIKPVNAIRFK